MMTVAQQRDLLLMLKTLADDKRLTMLGLMNGQERQVSEMSGLLNLTEPTVSHHISKLHSAGLLQLRMAGTQRFYTINLRRLAQFKAYIADIETLPEEVGAEEDDQAWIDTLDWPDDDKKILRDYTFQGKLVRLPTKERKWNVIVRWLAMQFDYGVIYTEKQVNVILTGFHEDYATLRRTLIEEGYMRREKGGANYWRTPDDEGPTG